MNQKTHFNLQKHGEEIFKNIFNFFNKKWKIKSTNCYNICI